MFRVRPSHMHHLQIKRVCRRLDVHTFTPYDTEEVYENKGNGIAFSALLDR